MLQERDYHFLRGGHELKSAFFRELFELRRMDSMRERLGLHNSLMCVKNEDKVYSFCPCVVKREWEYV